MANLHSCINISGLWHAYSLTLFTKLRFTEAMLFHILLLVIKPDSNDDPLHAANLWICHILRCSSWCQTWCVFCLLLVFKMFRSLWCFLVDRCIDHLTADGLEQNLFKVPRSFPLILTDIRLILQRNCDIFLFSMHFFFTSALFLCIRPTFFDLWNPEWELGSSTSKSTVLCLMWVNSTSERVKTIKHRKSCQHWIDDYVFSKGIS